MVKTRRMMTGGWGDCRNAENCDVIWERCLTHRASTVSCCWQYIYVGDCKMLLVACSTLLQTLW